MKQLIRNGLSRFGYTVVSKAYLDQCVGAKPVVEQGPPPVDKLLGRYQPPLTPYSILELRREFDLASTSERERISRAAMSRAVLEPQYARFVANSDAKHELVEQIIAAFHFAEGRLDEARLRFTGLVADYPSQLNYLTLGRIYAAMGNEALARDAFSSGLEVFKNDFFLTMELATSFYRDEDIQSANDCVESVRHHFQEEHEAIKPLQEEIEEAIRSKLFEKPVSKDIYSDDFVSETWWFYWRCYKSFNKHQEGSVALDAGIRAEVGRILSKNRVTTLVDFGAFCGHTIAQLAKEFPEIEFIGVDRPEIAKELNDLHWMAPNLEFVAGDILDVLENRELGDAPVIFHSRTAVFCYPEFLRSLYLKAKQCGVSRIILQEGSTFLSRWHLKFFEPGKYPQVSMAGRGSTFLHDYKLLLEEAGYKIVSKNRIYPGLLLDDSSGFGADHRILEAVVSQ